MDSNPKVPHPWVALPLPPSANRLWRYFRNRPVRSQYYNQWLGVVAGCEDRKLGFVPGILSGAFPKPVDHHCADVHIMVFGGRGLACTADLDNFIKPVIDALRHARVLPDDNVETVVLVSATYVPRAKKTSKEEAWCAVSVSWVSPEIAEARKCNLLSVFAP